jgi:cell wall-associated NlpC family hydrolase
MELTDRHVCALQPAIRLPIDKAMALRLVVVLLALGAGACASSGAIPKPFPGAPAAGAPEPGAPPVTAVAIPEAGVPAEALPAKAERFQPDALIRTAMGFRGVPYRNGGTDPSGFDCSGFVQYVFAQHGLALPREVQQQYKFGEPIDPKDARTGDLIYFSTVGDGATHVGLIVDGEQFVHAPSSKGVVRVERFSTRYWADRLVGVKRLK